MVKPISESSARQALLNAYSAAHMVETYTARRTAGGWVFGWNPQAGPPMMPTRVWVVSDFGVVRKLGFSETAAQVLDDMNGH